MAKQSSLNAILTLPIVEHRERFRSEEQSVLSNRFILD